MLDYWVFYFRRVDEDVCEIYNLDEVYNFVSNGSYIF